VSPTPSRFLAAGFVLLGLTVSACGSPGDAMAQALADEMMANPQTPDYIDRDIADCMGSVFVAEIGESELEAAGVSAENVADQADKIAAENPTAASAMFGCFNDETTLDFLMDEFGVDATTAQCVVDELGDDAAVKLVSGDLGAYTAATGCGL